MIDTGVYANVSQLSTCDLITQDKFYNQVCTGSLRIIQYV